ncbi:MAG: efflux RND transporter periplasmic adaptor subunit, partial [Sediminibacterium sp.]
SNVPTSFKLADTLLSSVTFDTVQYKPVVNSIRFTGMVDFNADQVVNIYPLISGNISGVTAVLGDYVTKGQVLGVVKSAEMANYSAQLTNAETNVLLADKILQQQKDLFKSGLASQIDLTNAEVSYQQAVAAKILAERVLKINGDNKKGEYEVRSPINGFIVQKNVTNNIAIRTDNSAAIFTISDLKNVWVQANVYEGNINLVHLGDEVDVKTISYPDKVFKGKIDKMLNVLDPNSKVMKIRVILPNDSYLLKPQMFATVIVNNKVSSKMLAIDKNALVYDHSQYYVITYKDKKEIAIRPVEVASINGDLAYLKSGLSAGEVVINKQALLLYGELNN